VTNTTIKCEANINCEEPGGDNSEDDGKGGKGDGGRGYEDDSDGNDDDGDGGDGGDGGDDSDDDVKRRQRQREWHLPPSAMQEHNWQEQECWET